MSSDSDESPGHVKYKKREKKDYRFQREVSPYERGSKERLRRPRSDSPSSWNEYKVRDKKLRKKDEDDRNRRKVKHKHQASRHSSVSSNVSSESDQEEILKRQHREERHEKSRRDRPKKRSPPSIKVKEEPVSDDERERHKRHHGDRQRREDDRPQHRRRDRKQGDTRHSGNQDARPMKRERDAGGEEMSYGPQDDDSAAAGEEDAKEKDKPDFSLSGKLTEETNTYKGVVIKYSEPVEARKPKTRWRLYPFKGDQALPVLYIHRQSAYLLGRERKIADIPIDHPSCSKQHAVLQYRLVPFEKEDGRRGHRVSPYIIDLESANGTYVNNKRIDPKRYVQLMEKDVLKFGFSSREYVILHDSSDTKEVAEESD